MNDGATHAVRLTAWRAFTPVVDIASSRVKHTAPVSDLYDTHRIEIGECHVCKRMIMNVIIIEWLKWAY